MSEQITVQVTITTTWTPDLEGDLDYPTIWAYAERVREQFAIDPVSAINRLPGLDEVMTVVEVA